MLPGVDKEFQKPSLNMSTVTPTPVINIYKVKVYANYIHKAGLAPHNLPTMGDLWRKQDEKVDMENERDVSKKKNRNV